MKSKHSKIFSVVFILALVTGLGWGTFILVKGLLAWFSGLDKEVVATILTALTAVTVSVVSLVLSKYFERRAVIRKEHREKKFPIYEKFIKFWFRGIVRKYRPDLFS